jgi:outer membrane lipoprotein-sorting protein
MEMAGLGDSEPTKIIIVHDGSTLWTYSAETNEYASISATELAKDAPGDQGDLAPLAEDHFMMWRYRSATDFVEEARLLREETIEIAGAKVDCYVVTVLPKVGGNKLVYTWWVDRQHFHVVREDNVGSSSVFTTIKAGSALANFRRRLD